MSKNRAGKSVKQVIKFELPNFSSWNGIPRIDTCLYTKCLVRVKNISSEGCGRCGFQIAVRHQQGIDFLLTTGVTSTATASDNTVAITIGSVVPVIIIFTIIIVCVVAVKGYQSKKHQRR